MPIPLSPGWRLLYALGIFLLSSIGMWILIIHHPTHTPLEPGTKVQPQSVEHVNANPVALTPFTPVIKRKRETSALTAAAPEKKGTGHFLNLPLSFDDLGETATELQRCKREHFTYMACLLIALYLYKQAFAIPGSFFLNLSAGALFGVPMGVLLCCVLTTVGSALSYALSNVFGKAFMLQRFGTQIANFQSHMYANSRQLFLFLIFTRLFPASPSWLVNIAAPVLDVPFGLFVVTTFLGLAPYIFIGVHAGSILSELNNWREIFNPSTFFQLTLVSLVPLALAYRMANPSTLGLKQAPKSNNKNMKHRRRHKHGADQDPLIDSASSSCSSSDWTSDSPSDSPRIGSNSKNNAIFMA